MPPRTTGHFLLTLVLVFFSAFAWDDAASTAAKRSGWTANALVLGCSDAGGGRSASSANLTCFVNDIVMKQPGPSVAQPGCDKLGYAGSTVAYGKPETSTDLNFWLIDTNFEETKK